MAAFRDQLDRETCPYPSAHVEARSWAAGWDHGAFKADGPAPEIAEGVPPRRTKPWSDMERAVMLSLARGGEGLTNLSARMGRPAQLIREECNLIGFTMTEDQLSR
ncbi:MAG TPA: hypothetical protein VGT77_04005 [Sphingomonas sp.]|jgi:hypothetical protein|nr:hypothetical protein [Sphingomonas sp.]